MNVETYAEIIHSRICHVQNLASALCGLEVTGIGALLAQKDVFGRGVQIDSTIFVCAYATIFWIHLFSMYQYYAVKHAALVLRRLEEDLKNYSGIKYFNVGNLRFSLYYIAHGLPSIVAFVAPIALYSLSAIKLFSFVSATLVFVLVTGIFCALFRKGFIRNSLLDQA